MKRYAVTSKECSQLRKGWPSTSEDLKETEIILFESGDLDEAKAQADELGGVVWNMETGQKVYPPDLASSGGD